MTRAMTEAGTLLPLSSYLPSVLAGQEADAAYRYFYDDLRTSIFHAKESRRPSYPLDIVTEVDLSQRQERLTRLYLDLLERVTSVRRLSGFITTAAFDALTSPLKEDQEIYVSDDPSPASTTDTAVAPLNGATTKLERRWFLR